MTRYRADIDGLRAVAVASVVLFHAGLRVVKGGFVGVDVFFVISGYLITANLHGDLQRGRFSILGFYERRARRILPALFVVMAACAVLSLGMLPDDLKLFGESVVAATLSLSNVFFYTHTGYFDLAAELTPLLHTWSLAVEEQFYLVFPPLLWLTARWGGGRRGVLLGVLLGLWALSFALGLWQAPVAPRPAFYLPFDRAWELLTGALLAAGGAPSPPNRPAREAAAAAGLLLIVLTVFLLPTGAAFPGLNAFPPCLGAALVIWAGLGEEASARPSGAARLLQLPPMVGLGLISYSLYLWHWPLLVFARYYWIWSLPPWGSALAVAVALLLSWASWRWVERPFRTRARLPTRGRIFAGAAGAGLLAGLFGAGVVLAHGLPSRLSVGERRYAAAEEDHDADRDRCFALTAQAIAQGELCRFGVQDRRRVAVALWGDSHAEALVPALDVAARAHGVAGLEVVHASCPPFLGVEVHENEDNGCPAIEAADLAAIERADPGTVILAGRWAGYAEGRLYHSADPPVRLRRVGEPAPPRAIAGDNHSLFAQALEATVAYLRREGRRVVLVLPTPEVTQPVGETLARAAMQGRSVEVAPTRAAYDARQRFVRATVEQIGRRYGAVVIDPAARLCPGPVCRVVQGGYPLYYDTDHLSTHGAAVVEPLVEPVFASAAERPPTAGWSGATR